MPPSSTEHSHFEGKDALKHVIEKQSDGIVALAESHGTELPGHLSSFADAGKEVAAFLLFLGGIATQLLLESSEVLLILTIFSCGLIVWKVSRSAWLGWSRLERLHRVVAEEQWEIEHHRDQERAELAELYRAKGFEGRLLEEVLDVLMADGDRLLRVMLEEELGLRLEAIEHPLKQGFGAGIGAFSAALLSLLGYWLFSLTGLIAMSFLAIAITTAISAHYEKNFVISAVVWNLGIATLSFGVVYFSLQYILS